MEKQKMFQTTRLYTSIYYIHIYSILSQQPFQPSPNTCSQYPPKISPLRPLLFLGLSGHQADGHLPAVDPIATLRLADDGVILQDLRVPLADLLDLPVDDVPGEKARQRIVPDALW